MLAVEVAPRRACSRACGCWPHATTFDKVGLKPQVMNTADFGAFITREKTRFTEAANLIGLKPQ